MPCDNLADALREKRSRKRERKAEAFAYLKQHVGDSARHAFHLGACYDNGAGVARDPRRAAHYYRIAAREDVDAQWNLYVMYLKGEGVPRDPKRALHYLRLAAAQNDVEAIHDLGYAYYNADIGVARRNRPKGYALYCQAAKMGDTQARYKVALAKLDGEGTKKDRAGAVRLLRGNLAKGHPGSIHTLLYLGVCDAEGKVTGAFLYNRYLNYREGKEVEQNLKLALHYLKQAAALDYPPAIRDLGYAYFHGTCSIARPDQAKGYALYCRAAKLGDLKAQRNAALCKVEGEGTKKDRAGAIRLLRDSLAKGHAKSRQTLINLGVCDDGGRDQALALYNLYWIYHEGDGVKQNDKRALHYLKQAAALDYPPALNSLGFDTFHGTCSIARRNRPKGYALYCRAAKLGDKHARYNAALCKLDGEGTKKDRAGAIRLLTVNAAQGDKSSARLLKRLRTR